MALASCWKRSTIGLVGMIVTAVGVAVVAAVVGTVKRYVDSLDCRKPFSFRLVKMQAEY